MLVAAIILFVVAALFGFTALLSVLKNTQASRAVVLTHGGFAAVGLVLVIVAVARNASAPVASLILFLIAAVGGFVLFALDLQKKTLPKALAILHPLIAAAGLVLLIVFVLSV